MPEFIQTLIDYVVYYKLEAIASIILLALACLRKHYDNNVMIAAFIRFTQDQVAEKLEEQEANLAEIEGTEHKTPGALKKAARRRKVRRELAKKARRANRGTGKGSKKGGGKVK
jgi:hypothetical protein